MILQIYKQKSEEKSKSAHYTFDKTKKETQ